MARPRKNAVKAQNSLLTPDKVAEVPVEEQPYPLPEGWKWVRGNSLWKSQETEKPTGNFFYYIDIDAVDNKQQKVISPKQTPVSQAPSRASRKLHEGDTIFSLVRPYLRNIAYIDEDISNCIASTGFYICSPLKNVNSRFLYWLMTSDYVVLGLNKFMKGDNSPSIRKNDIENFPFPLPTLDEQQRIVDRIEFLFAKLDEAKAKAEAVLDGFEIRKAAILHKAFTGELTAKWREENGIENDSWKEKDFAYIIRNIKAGKNLRCEERPPQENEIGIVKVSAVTWGFFNELESKTCIDPSVYNKNIQIKKGDFLFSRANTIQLIGNCVIVENIHKKLILSDKILRLEINKNISNKYILYFSMSTKYRKQITSLASGNQDGMRNISQKNLLKIKIPLPTEEEQQGIVRILDNLLAKEQQAKEAAETVLHQINLMKKAILARAFRGELGTHIPSQINPQRTEACI